MIYFVEAVGLDRVKIGTTFDVAKRLRALEGMCPCPVRLIRTMEGRHWHERVLHARFARHRVHGEWFVLSAIADTIAGLREPLPTKARQDADSSNVVRSDLFVQEAPGEGPEGSPEDESADLDAEALLRGTPL